MTAADWIAEQRRIEQAATRGPWEVNGAGEYVSGVGLMVAPDDGGVSGTDAEFIAAARTSLPKALDALEAVLALWPDADPCDRCVHVDCEVVRAITEALGVES